MTAPYGFVVAIDGPAGSGKTAAGLALAERLGAVFVDTGIFYRALTWLALQRSVSTWDGPALTSLVPAITSVVRQSTAGCKIAEVRAAGQPLDEAIRSADVEVHVGEVASLTEVRSALLPLQRSAANGEPAVIAGRDIGTVVYPTAQLKIYLDASAEERARRRAQQLGNDGPDSSVARDLAARDAQDAGRSAAPLARAADAILLDTDKLSLEQVVDELERLALARMAVAHGR